MVHVSTPQWELPLVLEALVKEAYVPLERSSMMNDIVIQDSFALTSAKRVGELCALSVHLSCLLLRGVHSGATDRNPPLSPRL